MKKKQPTVADVLHLAADKCLVAHSRYSEGVGKERFSCCAIEEAIFRITGNVYGGESGELRRRVHAGLRNMGCNTGSMTLFKKYGDNINDFSAINHEVQGMRYMWLKWAALMAEEQGV
jgi:hypothetical protein